MERMIITKSFDAFTKAVKSLHGEFSATPKEVVELMFNKLDKIDWKNPNLKILDPAAGFGTFLRESYIRLKEFHSEDHILNNMLYACEINGFKTLFLEKKMGLRNIYRGDFLTMQLPEGWPKEFDIVVSNPPYSKK
jgi:type I restriction-modification system DNA methylase subunit